MEPTLDFIATQLQQRIPYRYKWGRKQNDIWDGYSSFIYNTLLWEDLVEKMRETALRLHLDKGELFDYAANRWYNYWSAVAVEKIFAESVKVQPVKNIRDNEKDFYINNIPFDHKTSVFPQGFERDISYAKKNEAALIQWFYNNQSTQKRFHLKNRLFIVVYHKNGAHWKIKSEIVTLKNAIQSFLNGFNEQALHRIKLRDNATVLSAIIWVEKD